MHALGVLLIAFAGMLLGAQQVSAQSCMQDVWKAHGNNQNLNCTANDVTLASVGNLCVHVPSGHPQEDPNRPGCQAPNQDGNFTCVSGQDFTFTADYTMPLTAQARYDLGLYIATDGGGDDGAITGECANNVLTAANSETYFSSPLDRQYPEDICGDITDAHNPQVFSQTITTLCNDTGSGVSLPWCTSWRQPGADELCNTTDYTTAAEWDAYPGSPSKCNCGLLFIDVFSETASITVVKTALTPGVPETGGSATYSVAITANAQVSNVTIDTLTDNKYGDITSTHVTGGGFQAVTETTCIMPIVIAAGATYNCTFTGDVPAGNYGETYDDIVEACGTDDFGHSDLCDDDDASVPYDDVSVDPSLVKMSTGATIRVDVNYDVMVSNNSGHDTLTLTSLLDDVFGDITAVQGNVISTTCGNAVGYVIATNGSYNCSFVGRHTSEGTTQDRVSGTATDADGVDFIDPPLGDNASVTITVTTDNETP
jgi:hypothetical protein